ncbi:hypothetical protein BHM03_00061165 [Ensete ventricosum]|nr:hypothetical protein BHM03_00061165 [Ensete ventricosum]
MPAGTTSTMPLATSRRLYRCPGQVSRPCRQPGSGLAAPTVGLVVSIRPCKGFGRCPRRSLATHEQAAQGRPSHPRGDQRRQQPIMLARGSHELAHRLCMRRQLPA